MQRQEILNIDTFFNSFEKGNLNIKECVKKESPARYLMYLLTAIGLTPGGSSTVHMYTQAMHRTIQNKQYIEQHNNFVGVRLG